MVKYLFFLTTNLTISLNGSRGFVTGHNDTHRRFPCARVGETSPSVPFVVVLYEFIILRYSSTYSNLDGQEKLDRIRDYLKRLLTPYTRGISRSTSNPFDIP